MPRMTKCQPRVRNSTELANDPSTPSLPGLHQARLPEGETAFPNGDAPDYAGMRPSPPRTRMGSEGSLMQPCEPAGGMRKGWRVMPAKATTRESNTLPGYGQTGFRHRDLDVAPG